MKLKQYTSCTVLSHINKRLLIVYILFKLTVIRKKIAWSKIASRNLIEIITQPPLVNLFPQALERLGGVSSAEIDARIPAKRPGDQCRNRMEVEVLTFGNWKIRGSAIDLHPTSFSRFCQVPEIVFGIYSLSIMLHTVIVFFRSISH